MTFRGLPAGTYVTTLFVVVLAFPHSVDARDQSLLKYYQNLDIPIEQDDHAFMILLELSKRAPSR